MKNKEDLLNLNNNNKNPKKILIYIAIFFLIFVIGVIVYAIIQGNSSNKNPSESVIPPQVKEEPLFKQLPIEKENNVSTTKVSPEVNNSKSININKNTGENNNENTNKNNMINNESKNIAKPNKQVAKIQAQNIKKIPKLTPKKVKTHISKKVKGKYYIQVAALMKYAKPNKRFLELIRKYGYNYTFYTTTIIKGGRKFIVHKVLVGPFNSKKEAQKQLSKVKKYITQNAFIFKVNK